MIMHTDADASADGVESVSGSRVRQGSHHAVGQPNGARPRHSGVQCGETDSLEAPRGARSPVAENRCRQYSDLLFQNSFARQPKTQRKDRNEWAFHCQTNQWID
jgi:hypothetical protein